MNRPNNLRIYYQDPHLVVFEKPAQFQVHTPVELSREGKVVRKNNILILLRKQLQKTIYTVHRLDRATSGVMVAALDSETAKQMHRLFVDREVHKTYYCLIRGWMQDQGILNSPLEKSSGEKAEAETHFETVFRFELPVSLGKYPSERYSLMKVKPITGRTHQIRRHFKHCSHPLIGDTVHGDGKHNRLWRERLKWKEREQKVLFLKAYSIEFFHPKLKKTLKFQTRWNRVWLQLFDEIGFCPMDGSRVLDQERDSVSNR